MSSRAANRAALAKLRDVRSGVTKRDYEPKEAEKIYDEVDDNDYNSIVRGRLMERDFVEEDGDGEEGGYADNGEEDWDRSESDNEDDIEEERRQRKKAKKLEAEEKKKAALALKAKSTASAASIKRKSKLPNIAPGANPYINPNLRASSGPGGDKKVLQQNDDDFLDGLLGGLDVVPPTIGLANSNSTSSISSLASTTSSSFNNTHNNNTRPKKKLPISAHSRLSTSTSASNSSTSLRRSMMMDSSESDVTDSLFDSSRRGGKLDSEGEDTLPNTSSDGIMDGGDDMGGMDSMDFDDFNLATEEKDVDVKPVILPPSKREGEDGDLEDDDDLFIAPAAPVSHGGGPAKPKARRQLVTGAAVKPVTVVPKKEEGGEGDEWEKMKVDEQESKPALGGGGDGAKKPKGRDWRTATSNLAVAAVPIYPNGNSSDTEDTVDSDALPLPDSLKRPLKGGKAAAVPPPTVGTVDALEEDGKSLKFWWFDFIEPGNGNLVLVGKVKVRKGKEEGRWVSATLTVKGIRRRLWVSPRAQALDSDGNVLDDDEDPPEFDDVVMDFESDMSDKYGVTGLECGEEFVKRKYAFGIKGIPRGETDWIEATCDFPSGGKDEGKNGEIPLDAKGERYSHVFGSNTKPFERFVIDRKVMGPCWLNVSNATISQAGVSWTKFEVEAEKDDISVFGVDDPNAPKANPPLTVMSISLRTVINLVSNKREVVCACTRVWNDANIDDTRPLREQPSSAMILARPLHTPFPNGFERVCREKKQPGETVLPLKDEKAILSQLLATIFRTDPDIIVGYDFATTELDVLLNRIKELKVDHFSRIGRFKRPRWPKLYAQRNTGLLAGRLICDLNSDGSHAIIDSVTWSLTEMSLQHLGIEREDYDPDFVGRLFDEHHSTAAKLHDFVRHCSSDCFLQMDLAFKVQALPLSRQLTNLAGNSWNRTLAGNRAERNEYLLLHRFTEKGYVVPDKLASWEKKNQIKKEEAAAKKKKNQETGEEEAKVTISKEKFKGGLVFEPKKGLWDRYILVMDFNSLYPSIIQEFDIDFSTIDWTADDADEIIRSPCEGEPQGILPQLIHSLVDRRRNVKKLMKDRGVPLAKLKQYDITQLALKLTANSMYGCLGYEGSRFYAKPLAALTTQKGREILTATKADAESINLDVIYGDTDSVMINTNELDYAAAIRIGNEFKKLVNDKYKKLEIDTDNVFERMLLLAKKKYAARKVEEDGKKTTLEIKGLDMKRREYCPLAKDASKYVLDKILSPMPTEDVVDLIHTYLTSLAESVRAGKIDLEQFIINKKLGKNPSDYPDAKSQPHVTVALRLKAKGENPKQGDVVPYIFCVPEGGEPQTSAKAANAFHPDDVKRAGSTLKIDYEVYLNSQVLPPIERLCEPIEGTEKARLAECLGLDVARFRTIGELPEREFKTLQSKISDAERFAQAKPFDIRCRSCGIITSFDGLAHNSSRILTPRGFVCSDNDCAQVIPTASVIVQLDLQIRGFISKFYEGWMLCDDASCANRTRMMSVSGKGCLAADCRGQMHYEYTDLMLYNQLLYFDSLFDSDKARAKALGTAAQDEVGLLIEGNGSKAALAQARATIKAHLDKNGRRFINMKSIFGVF